MMSFLFVSNLKLVFEDVCYFLLFYSAFLLIMEATEVFIDGSSHQLKPMWLYIQYRNSMYNSVTYCSLKMLEMAVLDPQMYV